MWFGLKWIYRWQKDKLLPCAHGAPQTSAGPRTRAGAPLERADRQGVCQPGTMSAVRGAENNGALPHSTAVGKMNYTPSFIGKKTLGIHMTASQTSLQLILIVISFYYFYFEAPYSHPNWGWSVSRDQEGADVGCWSKAQSHWGN